MGIKIETPIETLRERKLFVAAPMYGGQCAGMFARSVADLSALCTHYGIQVRFYFLFNESLITRARNYCADEFMRSGDTHLMFIDSDIGFNANDVIALLALQSQNPDDDKYDILAGPYPKKCLTGTTTIETEDGIQTIASIVNNKYTGRVLSMGANGPEWNSVTNHWAEKNHGKKWVGVSTAKWCESSSITPRAKVICTEDHEIAVLRNPLYPVIEYVPASQTKGLYLVQTTKMGGNAKDSSARYPLLNKEQLSVLIGAALGDGCVTNGAYVANHGVKQEEYNRFKWEIIGGRFNATEDNNTHRFINGQTQYLKDFLYDGKQKTIKNVLDAGLLNEMGLAILYMDDGNRYDFPEAITEETNRHTWWYNEQGDTARCETAPGEGWKRGRKADAWRATASIATMSFTYEDNILLVEYLKNRFGLESYIYQQGNGYGIKFNKDNTDKLHRIVAKYIPECMEYKINPEYRSGDKHVFDTSSENYACSLIRSVIDVDSDSYLYDIEVESAHNFFVNDGALVHNCISWEKIKTAVDKGFADEDPQNLEKYVGDYVFNPANGQEAIPLGEPVEVLEAGTGFMMIRRNTFEKFQEAYPHQFYRPDHVRTEHFDGTREIMAFFDTPIDHKRTNINIELGNFLEANPKATHDDVLKFVTDPNNGMREYSKRYLSEDYMFCQWVRNAGMKVWFCPWMQLQHVGMYVFGGSLVDLAQIGAAATADPSQLKKKK